ncbi:MAG: magnesium chelatase subunit H [Proteobacteria bacterium]|nr:magnesium chelatase subunit H [Pseudomonadota bacterium]
MKRRPTSAADATPLRFAIVTMDSHLASATAQAAAVLAAELPGLTLTMHAAADWAHDADALANCRAAIGRADIVVVTMLFLEDHYAPILEALKARRESCDAMVCIMSAAEVVRLTRLGDFEAGGASTGPLAFLRRLRGQSGTKPPTRTGEAQMRMLRRIPRLLRFVPGRAQEVRAYLLTLLYWLGGSATNIENLVRFLVARYADGPRLALRARAQPADPIEYPDVGLYVHRARSPIATRTEALPAAPGARATVGLLVLRSYVIAGNTAHYDAVVQALEQRGLRVLPAFASGLDARPAIERFFVRDGRPTIDALVSLTGFSLVGGPAYNDARAAEEVLARLDVPYLAAQPVEFQSLAQWGGSERGLMPVESTMMIAIPELDGATGPVVYGGRGGSGESCTGCERNCRMPEGIAGRNMQACPERAAMLAARVARLIELRQSERADRKLGIVLFNFPPNSGHIGTAAYLDVFASLHHTLVALREAGYTVEVPESVDALRSALLAGNSADLGTPANVHARIPVDQHVRRERWLREIEAQWGAAPGRHQTDGSSIFVLGRRFGNVFVGVQPAFGYEGDPMRLLFEKGFAPTHAFSAFYRWLREDFGAHAVLHFGTHGALEFMPGKQTGLSAACWPDRLIGDLPNVYLYAANNPSEAALAKRRAAATTVSYLTPPIARAGLYRGLAELKSSIERWRGLAPEAGRERAALAPLIQAQAATLELAEAAPEWGESAVQQVDGLAARLLELEYALIPHGLHVMGATPTTEALTDTLLSIAEASHGVRLERAAVAALAEGASAADAAATAGGTTGPERLALFAELAKTRRLLSIGSELPALVHALDGGFVRPAPGGDVLRNPAVLPTGRNIHGFDPFRIPSAFAVADGASQAATLLRRITADGAAPPESIAIVLWGTDNLKSEGAQIAQALALLGARPRFDSYGRLAGAELVPLAELGRPRIDVVVTVSGIFRDLLPLQMKLLSEAAYLAAVADEPEELNYVRKHARRYQASHGFDLETAALRVFGNADGGYGANVNHLIESSCWESDDELAETFSRRKCFAYGRDARPAAQAQLFASLLGDVSATYQNLESTELGVTSIDTYFDTLGGVSRAVQRARGGQRVEVYIGDQTTGGHAVRSLSEQVVLETRTRMLNPRWYEGMLRHGYEGVRQIESHVTNTMGWSATTGQVAPWVYQQVTEVYLLDPAMRRRLAQLNPAASAKLAGRLIEAHDRHYWSPDAATLEALREANGELEDRLEGIHDGVAA